MTGALARVWINPYARLLPVAFGLLLAFWLVRPTSRVRASALSAYLLAFPAPPPAQYRSDRSHCRAPWWRFGHRPAHLLDRDRYLMGRRYTG